LRSSPDGPGLLLVPGRARLDAGRPVEKFYSGLQLLSTIQTGLSPTIEGLTSSGESRV
jgi:hypothetical protein